MKHKRNSFLILASLLLIPFALFAQSTTTPEAEVQGETMISADQLIESPNIEAVLNSFQAPKIIKNNVRISAMTLTKTEVTPDNEVIVEGTVEIKNNADTESSRLYMSSFAGIAGTSYFLQYPLYTDSRTDAFVLKPKEVVTRDFRVVQRNLSQYGAMGVEVWITDEYSKRAHAEVAHLPQDLFGQTEQSGTLFTGLDATWVVNGGLFNPNNGPTFYPNKDDMYMRFDFSGEIPDFINGVNVKIYDRDFFTPPVREVTVQLEKTDDGMYKYSLPDDLRPGVYPIQFSFQTTGGVFVPHVYGRFIVGGNMSKVTDVTLNAEGKSVKGITMVVQGNPPDIVNPDATQEIVFNAEIFAYDKNDKLLFSQKIENQNVSIYRNVDFAFEKGIKAGKITKVKAELSNETGIYSTYTKEFTYDIQFKYWNVVFVIAALALIALIVVLRRKKVIAAGPALVLALMLIAPGAEAGMTPTPSSQVGAFVYDAWDLNIQGNTYNDLDIMRRDDILDIFGIDVNFSQPVFYSSDPSYCYAPGQIIPVVLDFSYGICSNSPVTTCTSSSNPYGAGTSCGATGSWESTEDYADIRIAGDPRTWYWDVRDWNVNSTSTAASTSKTTISSHAAGKENLPQYSTMTALGQYVAKLASLNGTDYYSYTSNGNGGFGISSTGAALASNNNTLSNLSTMKWPTTITRENVDVDVTGFDASGTFDYSIVTPEKPGLYGLMFSMDFKSKQGYGYYVAEQKIRVCDTVHDADYLMPGNQYVDGSGVLRNEDGSELVGYTIQRYTRVDSGLIDGDVEEEYDEEWNPTGVVHTYVKGFNSDPQNEFSFVTVGNYCGSRYINESIDYGPTFSSMFSGMGNSWVNVYSFLNPANTRDKWNLLWEFLGWQVSNARPIHTVIRLQGYEYNSGSGYYEVAGHSFSDYSNYGSQPSYVVRKVGDEISFVNVYDPFLPQGQSFIDRALSLSQLVNVPRKTFAQMFNEGNFGGYSYINPATDSVENIHFVKENGMAYGTTMTTCSIYEDFCPAVAGTQYLLNDDGVTYQLWNIDSSGNHSMAQSMPRSGSTKAGVDAMCGAVASSTALSANCVVESPAGPEDRNPNTQIMFRVNASNLNPATSTTYTWTAANAMGDRTRATTTYATIGAKSNVSVQVKNGTTTVSAMCPVTIVNASIGAMCTGNNVALGLQSVYTAYPAGGTYQWKSTSGTNIPGATSQTYTVTRGSQGSYGQRVEVTKNGVTELSQICYANVNSGDGVGTPDVQSFRFNPHIAAAETNLCKLNLSVSNVSACSLVDGGTTISLDSLIAGEAINTTTYGVPVGTYTLRCAGTGETPTMQPYGTAQRCVSNPDFKEN